MKKTFEFGKIDYNHHGRRNCAVDVTVEFKEYNGVWEFTASGNIWNTRHTDVYCGGQCLDDIAKYVHNPEFKEIYRLWKKWHLNTMHAGTEKQEEALDAWHQSQQGKNKRAFFDYKKDCEYLDSIGLLFDDYDGKPYKYGCGWLTRIIPADEQEKILKLFS